MGTKSMLMMENRRLTRCCRSKHTIPKDLYLEILVRLPVKSLIRFRSVSKSWRLLIDDPQFCYLHFNRCKNNCNRDRLLIIQGKIKSPPVEGFIVSSETFETIETIFSWQDGYKSYEDINWFFELTYNGLVLLKSFYDPKWLRLLWNPSIRKCRLIPRLEGYFEGKFFLLGLGFDPLTMDYKIALLSFNNWEQPVAVYNVGKNAWETWPFRVRGGSSRDLSLKWNEDLHLAFAGGPELMCLRGCLYFILQRKQLGYYNLSTNAFTFMELPPPVVCDVTNDFYLGGVDGGCSVALFQVPHLEDETSAVWVLASDGDNHASSWAKRYTFKLGTYIRGLYTPSLKNTGGDLMFGCTDCGLVSRNIHTQEEKLLPPTLCFNHTKWVSLYQESLVLLN